VLQGINLEFFSDIEPASEDMIYAKEADREMCLEGLAVLKELAACQLKIERTSPSLVREIRKIYQDHKPIDEETLQISPGEYNISKAISEAEAHCEEKS